MTKSSAILRELLRAPLFQFLAIGLVIFLVVSLRTPEVVEQGGGTPGSAEVGAADRGDPIRVERAPLLAFVQRRTQQPNAQEMARTFDLLEAEAKKNWVDRFVREEALVREAKMLGLDRDDELIRRRLVQKMEFLTRGVIDQQVDVSDEALFKFLRSRSAEYRRPALFGFTHVFARAGKTQTESAERQATAWVEQFNHEELSAEAALSRGDRFLYNRSYASRTIDEVRSHFGEAFAEALSGASVDRKVWIGPIQSIHGWHVVLLTDRVEARDPTLEEVAPTLRADLLRESRDRALDDAIDAVVGQYRVEISESITPSRP